jgi:hypothetical protein
MKKETAIVPRPVTLPDVTGVSITVVEQLVQALNVPREILATNEDIATAWRELPTLLTKIPPHLRDPLLARMCVAVSVGLLDAAINYAWNSSMTELRNKVRAFGVAVVQQTTGKSFDEETLRDLQDSELLSLCLSLNLLTEEGYFMLDQCRDIRNNFSAAHAPIGTVDAYEYANFLNRCARYALNDSKNPRGVDTTAFISAVKADRFNRFQLSEWVGRMRETHEAQREALMSTLHGIYCDPAIGEEARLNALDLANEFGPDFTNKTKSELLNRHSGYSAAGEKDRHAASQGFFKKLGLLELLSEAERHTMVAGACKRLITAHQAYNNFYNEPPFAERLRELANQMEVPNTAKEEYVETVVTCSVGNQYGTCNAADLDYSAMIRAFSPKEVELLFQVLTKKNILTMRVDAYGRCAKKLQALVTLIDPKTVPAKHERNYNYWVNYKP